MPVDADESTVPITVRRSSSGSEDDSYVRRGPTIETPDQRVVVPITETLLDAETGINVERFLRTAIALAADRDARVVLLGLETVPDERTLNSVRKFMRSGQSEDGDEAVVETLQKRRTQLAEMTSVAGKLDPSVEVRGIVRAVTDRQQGIVDVLGDGSETAVLLLRGTELDDGWLLARSTVDAVLAEADCDVFVENVSPKDGESALYVPDVDGHTVASLDDSETDAIDSILLAVGTGPHAALAAEAARAVATATDASVTVLHVVSPDESAGSRSDAEDLLEFAEYVLGDDVTSDTELTVAADRTDAILAEATGHDFVSIGAPEPTSRLERLVFESPQETISAESDAVVLMSREAEGTLRSLYYRWKRGVESIDDEENT